MRSYGANVRGKDGHHPPVEVGGEHLGAPPSQG